MEMWGTCCTRGSCCPPSRWACSPWEQEGFWGAGMALSPSREVAMPTLGQRERIFFWVFACFSVVGRARVLCQQWSRAEWHRAHSQSLPGSAACCRAVWRRTAAVRVVRAASRAGRHQGWGSSAGAQGTPRASPGPCPWLGADPRVPPSPLHLLPTVGGTAGHVGLVQGSLPATCLPPPQTLLPAPTALQDPLLPWGRHLCPQPLQWRAGFGRCFHPNPTALCRPVPPDPPRGARAPASPQPTPQPTFSSLPGHGSLRLGGVSGQQSGVGPPGAGHWDPSVPTAPLKIGQ